MPPRTRAFANQLVVCLIVTIGFGASVGLGLVTMRHRNSTLAKSNSDLAARIAAVDRRNDEMATFIQTELRPELLRKLNTEHSLRLVPMNEVPVVSVTENVAERLAERTNRTLMPDAPANAPIRVQFVRR